MMQVVADEVEELSNLAIIVTPVMEIVNTSATKASFLYIFRVFLRESS